MFTDDLDPPPAWVDEPPDREVVVVEYDNGAWLIVERDDQLARRQLGLGAVGQDEDRAFRWFRHNDSGLSGPYHWRRVLSGAERVFELALLGVSQEVARRIAAEGMAEMAEREAGEQ